MKLKEIEKEMTPKILKFSRVLLDHDSCLMQPLQACTSENSLSDFSERYPVTLMRPYLPLSFCHFFFSIPARKVAKEAPRTVYKLFQLSGNTPSHSIYDEEILVQDTSLCHRQF